MPARLIIRFDIDPTLPAQWLRLDADGRAEGEVESGPLSAAAPAAAGRQVTALVPGFDVLLLSARIPTQSRQKLARAIPFALEDQLADDIDDLHFVAGRRDAQDRLAVAVIAKERLTEWLDACTAAGFQVDHTYPEILALPYEEGAWTLLVEEHRFLIRTGLQSGYAGDTINAVPLLRAGYAEAEAEENAPRRLLVYGDDVAGLDELDLEIEQHTPPHPLAVLAANIDPKVAIDLRSGEFARKRNLNANWRRWEAVAAILLAWVVVDTGTAYLQQWQHSRELAEINSQISQTFQQAFPGSTPPHQHYMRSTMENRLNALRGGGSNGGNGLLELLATVGPTLQAEPSVQLSSLNYRNGEIDLEFMAESLQSVDQLKQKLDNVEGVAAEVRNARAEGERVQGRLRIGAS